MNKQIWRRDETARAVVRPSLALVLTLGLLAALVVVTIPVYANGWTIETVDSGTVGLFSSIALDGNGYPHISYYDVTNGDLKYAHYNGASWQIETVDSGGDVGSYTSIALDASGHPHISYHDNTNDDLKYAYHDGASWQTETVDSGGDVGEWTSIALDASGRPHISYYSCYDETNGDLKYAYHDGSGWQIETVDSGGNVGGFTSIALDASGHPHISYCGSYDEINGDLKYAHYNGASWQIETVDSGGEVGFFTSIALDASGRPHISYCDWTNDDLKYAYHDGSSWQIETVDSSGNVGWSASIALDASGRPHISYYGHTNYDLKYAHYKGTSWQIETVDSGACVGLYGTSIALDASGRAHISYFDIVDLDLKYAHRTGPSTYSIDYVVAHWVSGALDPNDPCQISLDQILQAIAWWAAATPVPQTGGQTIDLDKILDLIAKWANGTCIDSSATPQSLSLPKALPADEAALVVNAARSITSTAEGPVEVTVTVTTKQAITGLALDEDLPEGWKITPIDNAGATFNAQETQWLWLAVDAGETKTIRYQVKIPSAASLEALYEITGVIRAASPSLVLEVVGDVQLGERLPAGKLEVVAIPNPVRDVHTVTFHVQGALASLVESVKVQIFNLAGRLVYEREEEGTSLDWHTDNSYGEYLANGVYLYKLYALIEGNWVVSEVKKLAILR